MAKIVKTDTQEQALRTINNNLRTLTGVNGLLNSKEESCGINLIAGKQRAFVMVEKNFGDMILQDIRRKLVKETKTLAKRNAVVLDGSDMEILDNQYLDKDSPGAAIQDHRISDESLTEDQEMNDGRQ